MEDKKVIIKHIEKQSWSGHHRFPKCKDTVIASGGKDGYVTGLTPEEATRLEKALLMDEGNLSKYSTFWKDYAVNLSDKDLELDLSKPMDFLDFRLLMASPRVAPSLGERDKYPKAEYVIHDVAQEAKAKNLALKAKKKAFAEFAKMGHTEMVSVLKVMGKPYKTDLPEVVENAVNDVVENDPKGFLEVITDPTFKDKLFLEDLIANNIVRKNGSKYYYGDDSLGIDLVSTIAFIRDPKNQDVKLNLKQQLEAKQKVAQSND